MARAGRKDGRSATDRRGLTGAPVWQMLRVFQWDKPCKVGSGYRRNE